jgi:hypothetical protein
MSQELQGPILEVLQPVAQALAELRESFHLSSLGKLQGVVTNVIGVTTSAFQPVHDAVTALLVQTRSKYVAGLTDEQFLALVGQVTPGMLSVSLEKDCDDDGNPLYEGKEVPPAIDANAITARDREKFAAAAGFHFVDAVLVERAAVDIIEDMAVRVAIDRQAEIVEAFEKSRAAYAAHATFAMPMMNMRR